MNTDHPAIVLGMFETGLAVGRSLGRNNINVFGLDFKKDIGFYSKYIKTNICPHPLRDEENFLNFLIEFGKKFSHKAVLFITSDDFLIAVLRNRQKLFPFFLFNLSEPSLIQAITNKYQQYQLAKNSKIPVPNTFYPQNIKEVENIINAIHFPVFIKAKEVNRWREKISASKKGFLIQDKKELLNQYRILFKKEVPAIVQEVVQGPDTNHFKFCAYISQQREFLATFMLKKIRQNPVHFGVGVCVESIFYPELENMGKKFFRNINFRGVGSAEFKLDKRDGQLKLIELNPRYWQQNSLADKCGVNFPLINYLDLTGQHLLPQTNFKVGIKWVNIYSDFNSYLSYRKEKPFKFKDWIRSLKGPKVFSDWVFDDIIPGFYEIRFGKRLLNLPRYFYKNLKANEKDII